LLLLYALARLKHDRQTEIRFNATEAALQPLLRVYGPWGASARVSYSYSRLLGDGLWQLHDRAELFDAGGNIREGVARERDAPAGFGPDVLATFEREPELIDVAHTVVSDSAPCCVLQVMVGCGAGNGLLRTSTVVRAGALPRSAGRSPVDQAHCLIDRRAVLARHLDLDPLDQQLGSPDWPRPEASGSDRVSARRQPSGMPPPAAPD
jgi:hypothetical protein